MVDGIYDRNTVSSEPRYFPIIKFSDKRNCSINGEAVRVTEFKAGDEIAFYKDPKQKNDWYIYKSKTGFELYRESKINKRLSFNCRNLVRILYKEMGLAGNVSFRICAEPEFINGAKHWLIFTTPIKG